MNPNEPKLLLADTTLTHQQRIELLEDTAVYMTNETMWRSMRERYDILMASGHKREANSLSYEYYVHAYL